MNELQLPKEIDDLLMPLEQALIACFGEFREKDDGYLVVECCGAVKYGSGIMGPDTAYCTKCGRAVLNVLSPHVSPLLISGSTTAAPSQALIDAVGERQWMVKQSRTLVDSPVDYVAEEATP